MHKVLVVVDMQNDFVGGKLGSKAAEEVVPKVCSLIRDGGWDRIIVTMDTHDENYPSTLEGLKLPVAHCIEGTPGHDICDKVLEAVVVAGRNNHRDFCVDFLHKVTFGSVNLPAMIKKSAAQDRDMEIHICGLCTDICVVSNALLLRAFYPDTDIVCHASCCAGTSEDNHKAALTTMRSCQIDIEGE